MKISRAEIYRISEWEPYDIDYKPSPKNKREFKRLTSRLFRRRIAKILNNIENHNM